MKMQAIYRTYPLERIGTDEDRIVEGYAFVNEIVPGEGGIRLKRSAMEAATANYLANGTSRELHQASAAGTPLDVTWDEKGALLRVHVVDDQAWAKVKAKVYKGFSVGVIPEVMRGKDVEKCNWWDSSLVDVGKDHDAKFTVWRSEEISPDDEFEVKVERASFNEYLEDSAPSDLRDMALDYLWMSFIDIQYSEGTPEEKEVAVRATCAEFTEWMVGAVATGKLPQVTDTDTEGAERSISGPFLTRLFGAEAELAAMQEHAVTTTEAAEDLQRSLTEKDTAISTLTKERDDSAIELTRVQQDGKDALARATKAEEEVEKLKDQPTAQRPVVNAALVERSIGTGTEHVERAAELDNELAAINALERTSDANEVTRRTLEIQRIKREQSELIGDDRTFVGMIP